MLKRLSIALLGLFLLSPVYGAGTVPGFSLTPQFDLTGHVMSAGCQLFVIQAGTTSAPQTAYQDSGLTIPSPGGSTLSCDATGRLPQFFLADGSIKFRLVDHNGVQVFTQDGLLVVGASSGGGGGSPVDPTTILQTGWIQPIYGTGTVTGFVRLNGRTIGNASSGATERANSDTTALFAYLYNADVNLAVSGGRGVSAAADYAANKTIALPDWRGRALAALDDMGNSAASRLTATYFGTSAIVLGAAGGSESKVVVTGNLPPYTPTGTISNGTAHVTGSQGNFAVTGGGTGLLQASGTEAVTFDTVGAFTGTAQGGTSTPVAVASPMMLTTFYVKL